MKMQLQYLNDQNGDLIAVQIPIEDWKKLEKKIHDIYTSHLYRIFRYSCKKDLK